MELVLRCHFPIYMFLRFGKAAWDCVARQYYILCAIYYVLSNLSFLHKISSEIRFSRPSSGYLLFYRSILKLCRFLSRVASLLNNSRIRLYFLTLTLFIKPVSHCVSVQLPRGFNLVRALSMPCSGLQESGVQSSANDESIIGNRLRYRLDLTINYCQRSLNYVVKWFHFVRTFFWTNFWTILSEGRTLVLREGWDAVYHHWGRGGSRL